jgi:hypothetical protein
MAMPETQAEAFVRALNESAEQTKAYLRSVHAAAARDTSAEEVVSQRAPSAKSKPFRAG